MSQSQSKTGFDREIVSSWERSLNVLLPTARREQPKLNFEEIKFYDSHYSFTEETTVNERKKEAYLSTFHCEKEDSVEADALLSVSSFINFVSCQRRQHIFLSLHAFCKRMDRHPRRSFLQKFLRHILFEKRHWQTLCLHNFLCWRFSEKKQCVYEGEGIFEGEALSWESWCETDLICHESVCSIVFLKIVTKSFHVSLNRGRAIFSRNLLPSQSVSGIKLESEVLCFWVSSSSDSLVSISSTAE